MHGIVYLITNLVNGKYYIGQTTNLYKRMWGHAHSKAKTPLACAVRKYGWENFRYEVLGEAEDKHSLDNLEILWIIISAAIESGYNLKDGGANGKPSAESRKRMSESQKANPVRYWLGKKRPDNAERNKRVFTGKKSWNAGTRKPKPTPKDRTGSNNHFFGRKHDEATRQKISESVKRGLSAFKASPEWREHQRNASLSRWAKQKGRE